MKIISYLAAVTGIAGSFLFGPFIIWLSRWLPIEPYSELVLPRLREIEPIFDRVNNVLYCSTAQELELNRQLRRRLRPLMTGTVKVVN
jgi:hypothetical protein